MKKFIVGLVCGAAIASSTAVIASDTLQAYLFPSQVAITNKGTIQPIDVTAENTLINYNNKAAAGRLLLQLYRSLQSGRQRSPAAWSGTLPDHPGEVENRQLHGSRRKRCRNRTATAEYAYALQLYIRTGLTKVPKDA
ncbi:hypothetical protein [Paenibacillus ginsengarvi]|uniref:Uncharacterized protein n=1 Tax=Paenibacillus ginsengarvi TaxID=400777 RepID=A0A3B0BRB6_9BACL|nr:hypothetical protein [Paenibacillus ginsengarvi]RKN75855.1 hypothetical protein D7M11_25460 [Paenibacillus ginsengarvi]